MKQEVFADKTGLPEWRVEALGDEGECYVTVFAGPSAELRAKRYVRFCDPLSAPNTADWMQLSDSQKISMLEAARDGAWAQYVETLERLPESPEEIA